MSRLCLWTAFGDAEPAPLGMASAVEISAAGVRPASAGDTARDAVLVLPLEAVQGPVAVALVPAALCGSARRCGLALEAGLHTLQHADALELAGWTVWVAGDGSPAEEPYDEALHGPELYCMRTKARLRPGDSLVRCPGSPSAPCGLAYRADAWSLRLQCPACRHDPRLPAWRPTPVRKRRNLSEIARSLASAGR